MVQGIKKPGQSYVEYIRPGNDDIINVLSIDRLARNIEDLNKLVKKIVGLGATITFHKESLTFGNGENSPASDQLFNVPGSFAQLERAMIKERQAEGIAAAKASGRHMGRPGKFTNEQKSEIEKKHKEGMNPTKLAKEYGVSRGTIYNIVTAVG